MDVNFKVIKESLEAINAELESMIAGVDDYYVFFGAREQNFIKDLVDIIAGKAHKLKKVIVDVDDNVME